MKHFNQLIQAVALSFLVASVAVAERAPVVSLECEQRASYQDTVLRQCQMAHQADLELINQLRAYLTLRETDLLFVVAQSDARQRQLVRVQGDLTTARQTIADRDAEIRELTGQRTPSVTRPGMFDVQTTTQRLIALARRLARGKPSEQKRVRQLSNRLGIANAHNAQVAQAQGFSQTSSEELR